MSTSLEREIKLRFASPIEAKSVILSIGATAVQPRRLQRDHVLDTSKQTLHQDHSVLRVRIEPHESRLTFKGPPQSSTMKLREEIELTVEDGSTLLRVLERVGFHVAFRYEKYREEFNWKDVIIALDETPIGTFVELEGTENSIHMAADRLGRTPSDYVTKSYHTLFIQHCESSHLEDTHMLFGNLQ